MCSIVGILDIQAVGATPTESAETAREMRQRALRLSARLRHRGPDWSGIYADERVVLAHERLAIVDPENGAQPLRDAEGRLVLAVNGEIYNHRELARELSDAYDFQTASDCEVIMPLFREHGVELLGRLNGIFAFILYDRDTGESLIARDPIGVIPLYMGWDERGRLHVASELKALVGTCPRIEEFPPGHYWISGTEAPVRYYAPAWRSHDSVRGIPQDPDRLREAFRAAVHRQLMSDVPYGVLLSGGLDSSLVAATAARFAAHRIEDDDRSPAWWPRLHTFAIGLEDSPDLAAAQTVADAIGSEHHGVVYTVQEGIDALTDVIYHIESYDVTTVRASTPMFLLARIIRAMGIKMVLSGEGADEIFGGYLYFHKAPNAREFHEETVRKIDALHQFDCLRANKSMAAWGVEARVPFLDIEFVDVAMGFDAAAKMTGEGRMEKHVLRKAHEGLLPHEILWRQKEQFSDGVGYSWIDSLRAHAESEVSDHDLATAHHRFPVNTPLTKEAYLYRAIFDGHFPGACAAGLVPGGPSIACSTPTALRWDASFADLADPSGRAVAAVHKDAYRSPKES
jgi:asparagine synthase (glutamine-hydrolysing)